jgi:hypothetical protein
MFMNGYMHFRVNCSPTYLPYTEYDYILSNTLHNLNMAAFSLECVGHNK